MAPPKAVFLMADYGHDPTETATPFVVFREAGFDVSIATETGNVPKCDEKMLSGMTGKFLGAARPALNHHEIMLASPEIQKPLSWTSPSFSLSSYDLVFLPGGHDKGLQQIILSKSLHRHLASYMPLTKRGSSSKVAAAICHGVQVLASAETAEGSGKSVMHDFETTALPNFMEQGIYYATYPFLGDYYKTFGGKADSVEVFVRKRLDDPEKQYKSSLGGSPFVVEDPTYNYLSGRFPPDAQLLAEKTVALVQSLQKTST